jgi:arylsulfatase A
MSSVAGGFLARSRPPNVVLILSDDQGYGDLSCHGNPHLRTPNLDRFAAQSVEFSRFYVSPVCAPTRASLLTGRYNIRCGVHGVTGGRETMAGDETTLAETLRGRGYRTALIGKWHLGEAYPHVPHAQGFDHYVGFRTGHWNHYFDALLEHNGKPYPTDGYIADALTGEALRYLEANRSNPFFLYLAYNTPHTPYQVPDRYFQKYLARGMQPGLASIYGMIENLDENVGRLLSGVNRLGLARDTIVIFMTDNGPNGERYNAGLRGRKGTVYEGGVRVPFFIRWPGRFQAGRKVNAIAAHIDIYPTLLDLCGAGAPKGRALDGLSLRSLIENARGNWPDRPIYTHSERPGRENAIYPGAIRTQRFTLVNGAELYETEADPGESKDVAASYPEKTRELRDRYRDWFASVIAERGFTRYPLQVGHAEENPVYLPATQAYFSGEIHFRGKNGFAHDWLTGWRRTEDRVHWEIDVVQPGRYSITLEYLCPQGETGAIIEVSAAGRKARVRVERPTSMRPLPDRNLVPNTHYITMPWGTLGAGLLEVPGGRTQLAVMAVSAPGGRVMDLKAAVVTRAATSKEIG